MKIKNLFATEVFFPEQYSMTMEIGTTFFKLCKQSDDVYKELGTKDVYREHNRIGYVKVVDAVPLSEYYYPIGLKRRNSHCNKDQVHELVKTAKSKKLL